MTGLGMLQRDAMLILRVLRWGSLVVPALLAAAIGTAMWLRAVDQAETGTRANARLVADYALRLIQTHDLLLTAADTALVQTSEDPDPRLTMHRYLAAMRERLNLWVGVTLVSANGNIVLSSTTHPAAGNVGDLPYLRAESYEASELFIDRMWVEPGGAGALVIARARDGSPENGVWVSAVRIEAIAEFLQDIAPREGDAASLMRADGTLLVRNRPMTEPVILEPDMPAMRAIAEADRGIYRATAVSDGMRRLYAFSRVGNLPLYAHYGVSRQALLTAWLEQFAVVVALLGTIGLIGFYLVRYVGHSIAAEAARAVHEFDRKLLAEAEKTAQARAMMLKELNHRVKNSLQMIRSLMRLQAHRADGPDLDEIGARVSAIATIHDLLYQSADAFSIDLASLLARITESEAVVAPERNIEVTCALEPMTVDANLATPLALCVVELVTNAAKHAFGPEGGRIEVSLRTQGDKAVLSVADDGRGMSDLSARKSGLRVVDALVMQIGGELAVRRDGGTCFEITFDATCAAEAAPPPRHAAAATPSAAAE